MPTTHEMTLIVDDLDRSKEFYRDVLGLTVSEQRGSRIAFETGQCTLVLEGELDKETFEAYGLRPPGDDPGRGVVIGLRYEDVDEVYERAVDTGAAVLFEPRDAEWGERLFLLRDPDGYVIDIVELR